MPDHIHLLVLPALGDTISALMQELKHATARCINTARRRNGTVWQKGFFDRFMRTPKEFSKKLEYLHLNPVGKGLVLTPERWKWSSFAAYLGKECILNVDAIELPAQAEQRLK